MDKSNVAVVIFNYMSWKDTLNEAIIVHDLFGFQWSQIIIVDNCSPNESKKELSKKDIGDYVFIASDKNKGYAAGNNIGLRYANKKGFKYAWILNNDIVICDQSVLDKMLGIMQRDSSIGVINPDILDPNGKVYNRDSKRKNLFDFTLGLYSYKNKGRCVKDLGGYGYVYRPQGCCMMVDLSKMVKIKFMDEKTFLYCEEFILAERLLKHKWKCACATDVSVIHNHSKTVKSAFDKWSIIKIQLKSFNYYLKRYRKYNFVSRAVCSLFFAAKAYLTN